jgi:hypothetical protein
VRVVSLPSASRAQKTFVVALALLGAGAVAQILTALYLYTREPREALPPARKSAIEARLYRPPKLRTTPAAAPVNVPAVAGVPSATVTRVPAQPNTVAETLLRLAKGFRERGDMTNAIAKLQRPPRSIRATQKFSRSWP